MISQCWIRYTFGTVRQQAFTWTSVDQDPQCHMGLLGRIELMTSDRTDEIILDISKDCINLFTNVSHPHGNDQQTFLFWAHKQWMQSIYFSRFWYTNPVSLKLKRSLHRFGACHGDFRYIHGRYEKNNYVNINHTLENENNDENSENWWQIFTLFKETETCIIRKSLVNIH